MEHHDVSGPRQSVAQIDDARVVTPRLVGAKGKQHCCARFPVTQTVDVRHCDPVSCPIMHLLAQRVIGEPGLGLDGCLRRVCKTNSTV